MTVAELIKVLETKDPEALVSVWDNYYDEETTDVSVSSLDDNIHIGCTDFGD